MRRSVLLTLAMLACGCAGAPRQAMTAEPVPVTPVGTATWQLFYLPRPWVQAHFDAPLPLGAYVQHAPPHRDDLADGYAPCPPPTRIVLGIVDDDGRVRETTLSCLDVCSPDDAPGKLHRGLWGSSTHITGLTVALRADGALAIGEHYRERGFSPPAETAPTAPVVPTLLGEQRVRSHIIAPQAFHFEGSVALACSAGEQ